MQSQFDGGLAQPELGSAGLGAQPFQLAQYEDLPRPGLQVADRSDQ
ncbi:MAG TPA: hypothetical protein VHM70_31575 [Polyangiaceae bacterium]|nr:hypothetical protein [Polyangiaceae bacterium]